MESELSIPTVANRIARVSEPVQRNDEAFGEVNHSQRPQVSSDAGSCIQGRAFQKIRERNIAPVLVHTPEQVSV